MYSNAMLGRIERLEVKHLKPAESELSYKSVADGSCDKLMWQYEEPRNRLATARL